MFFSGLDAIVKGRLLSGEALAEAINLTAGVCWICARYCLA